jgi:hypothetical protein
MITEIELSGIKYPITSHENVSDGLKICTFSVVVDGKTFPLRATYTSKSLDSPSIFGISAKEELRNIMYLELKAELFGIVYNVSFAKQCEIASECKNDEELFAVSSHDSVFAAWLYNFDREQW